MSSWSSIVIGIALGLMCFLLQPSILQAAPEPSCIPDDARTGNIGHVGDGSHQRCGPCQWTLVQ